MKKEKHFTQSPSAIPSQVILLWKELTPEQCRNTSVTPPSNVTEKYSHLSKSHKREAIKVMSFISDDETKLKQIAKAGM